MNYMFDSEEMDHENYYENWDCDSEYDKNDWDITGDNEFEPVLSKRELKRKNFYMRKEAEKIDVFNATQDFLYCIERELMEKAWNPARYMQWCLDIDEQKELEVV